MTIALRILSEEPFGSRMHRARIAAGLELRPAAETISRYMFISHTSLHRLEHLDGPPLSRRTRALGYLALLVYGFDPSQFGLTDEDLPEDLAEVLRSAVGAQPAVR